MQEITNISLLKLFRRVSHLQQSRVGRTRGQRILLMSLYERGGMTQRELAELAQRTAATLSEQLETMEAAGLIRREKSRTDKRHVDVALTESGEQAAREAIRERQETADRLFSLLDDDEKQALYTTLGKLADAWARSEQPCESDTAEKGGPAKCD